MEAEPVRKVLVELDTLLDTRLGTLSRLDQKAARDALKGDYRQRRVDDFEKISKGRITNDDFWESYRRRDKETLARSRVTGIPLLLFDLSREVEGQKVATPFVEKFQIDLNVYPYEFEDWEQRELKALVRSYVAFETSVNIVSYPIEEITPIRIKENWGGVILYEFDRWFTQHVESLNENPIPRCLMFVPALLVREPENESDLIVEEAENLTPFNVLEMSMVEYLALEMLKVEEFSIIKP